MKKLLALALTLLAATVQADDWQLSSRAISVLDGMFVQNAKGFGPPAYAADPFTCDSTTKRITYYNTVSNTVLYCNGTAWTTISGSGGGSATSFSVATGRSLEMDGLSDPGTPTVTPQGTTGATTYGYKIVAVALDGTGVGTLQPGTTAASVEGTTATGNATLDGTNFNRVTWSAVTNAAYYDVYRTTGGSAPPKKIASLTTALTLDDTGIAGSAMTPPVSNTTGHILLCSALGPCTNSLRLKTYMSGTNQLDNYVLGFSDLPTTTTTSAYGAVFTYRSGGSSSNLQASTQTILRAGYTGSATTISLQSTNAALGTGADLEFDSGAIQPIGNIGISGSVGGTSALQVGLSGFAASGATTGIGVIGKAVANGSNSSVGVLGAAIQSGSVSTTHPVGVAAFLSTTTGIPAFDPAVFLGDNTSSTAPLMILRDNGASQPTTGATATWNVKDGAFPQYGNGVLTSATMTADDQAYQTTVSSSYSWTNAMVTALGGVTAGDVTVATLPAKTQLLDALVVIKTAAAGVTTLTVSCGDAIGGTPFINLVAVADAKAAANTVYGDALAERGTSIDTEFYYTPSYTATTLVTCHFISTGANLSAVTTSTGRVILTTRLLP